MGISPSKNAQVAATPNNPSPLRDLQDFLLQPPPDKSIRQSWTVLQGMIESHVDSFYNTGPVQVNPAALANNIYQSSSIFATQREAERLAGLLCSESLRKLGIQKYIATILLADIDFFGDPSKTALDKGAVEMLGRFKDLKSKMSPEEEEALAYWRMVTAFFLQRSKGDVSSSTHFIQTCRELLEPFTEPQQKIETRVGSLQALCQQAREVADSLFCHPSEWVMQWHAPPIVGQQESEGNDLITVFPALCRWSKRREKLHLIQEARVFSTATEPPPIASLSSVSLGKTATRRATNDPSKTDDSSATHALEPEGSHNERRGSYSKSFSRRSTYDRNLRRNGREDRLPDPGNGLRVSRRNDASR
ncbi:hypothetical protein FJTKL_08752 [Diaporthe vaccinii]|uniref:Uncharacterized protein n=1 Tax=Diaporthe vaccinii TaxID=105482 RepID=A0ABR4EQD9_9PEZI